MKKSRRVQKKTKNKRIKKQKTKKQKGGFLCSPDNPRDKYTLDLGKKLGSGEEGVVYLDKFDENIVIKEFYNILLTPGYHKKINYLKHIFDINKDIGDMGIGPKIYYYKICKKNISVNLNTIAKNARSRLAARFYGIGDTPNIIKYTKTQPNGEDFIFTYEAYVPYLVMEKISGHKITNNELDIDENMDQIYQMYTDLYHQDLIMQDLHTGNIIINPETHKIFFIDSGAYRAREKPPLKTKEQLKEIIKEPSNEEWIHRIKISDLDEGDIELI